MKIIGKAGDEYIVQMTEGEISVSLGFDAYCSDKFKEATAGARERTGYGGIAGLKVGAVLMPINAHRFVQNVHSRGDEVRKLAGSFRALADLIEQPLDQLLAPTPKEDEQCA
jgi:hypothetical protein